MTQNAIATRKPKFYDDEAFRCLRCADVEGFQQQIASRDEVDFSDADFRGVDFRKVDLSRVILRGAYLKGADLRGVDLRNHDMAGCSLHDAQVAGAFFPTNIAPEEIRMSISLGTRMRTCARQS